MAPMAELVGGSNVDQELVVEHMFHTLISGDRVGSRRIVQEILNEGIPPEQIAHEVYWPVMEMINTLFRADQLSTLAHHYGVRLLRSLVDQAQVRYSQQPALGRKIVMFCGTSEADELAGQLVADLLEANGYEIYFGGGGIANDEILAEVGERDPDILLMFASGPADAPNIRQLIDKIRSVGARPQMQIVVGGGVFNRAEGLAEEIGADLWAKDPATLIGKLATETDRRATPEQHTVGRHRRTKKTAAA